MGNTVPTICRATVSVQPSVLPSPLPQFSRTGKLHEKKTGGEEAKPGHTSP